MNVAKAYFAAIRAVWTPLAAVESETADRWPFVWTEETVEAAMARVEAVAAARGVELFVQCDGGRLRGDADALATALGNVVLAAIEATPAKGAVFVATYRTASGAQFWTVQGTGVGLPRWRWATLALANARDIVERHGGKTKIETPPGSGMLVSIAWGGGTTSA